MCVFGFIGFTGPARLLQNRRAEFQRSEQRL